MDLSAATVQERLCAVQEVIVLKTISHPNIVKYMDSFVGRFCFLVTTVGLTSNLKAVVALVGF